MDHILELRTGPAVVTLVNVGTAVGLCVGDEDGSAVVRLTRDNVHRLREWLAVQHVAAD